MKAAYKTIFFLISILMAPGLYAEGKEVSLLIFGNSYSMYAEPLPAIAQSMGDKLDIVCLRNSNSVDETIAFLEKVQKGEAQMPTPDEAAKMKSKEQKQHGYCGYQAGAPSRNALVNIKEMLESRQWDYVALQAHSSFANDYKAIDQRIKPLTDYLKKYHPETKFVYYQTTQYRNDELLFKVTPNRGVYRQVRGETPYHEDLHHLDAYNVGEKVGETYGVMVIPGGTALENGRYSPLWGETYPDPDFDYFNAVKPAEPEGEKTSLHYGLAWRNKKGSKFKFVIDSHPNEYLNYLTACVWYEKLFGKSCVGSGYVSPKVTAEQSQKLQTIAHETVQGKLPPLRLMLPETRTQYGDILWQRASETKEPAVKESCLFNLYAYIPEHPKAKEAGDFLKTAGKLEAADAAAAAEKAERPERERKYKLIWEAAGKTTLENDKKLGRWTDL